MGSRSGSRVLSVNVKGLKELDAFMRDQIAREDLNPAKRDLRQGTKKIATDIVIPALKAGAASSGVPIAPAMADTARTRTDRLVTVRIGAVNPKLSGFKSGRGAKAAAADGGKTSQSYRTTLAWGSDKGPYPGAAHNHYGVGRNERGWWVLPTIAGADTWGKVRAAYQALLDQILADYGKYR